MKISLAITTFNRVELTLKSFEKVYNDKRIGEILILDDCSDMIQFEQLKDAVAGKRKIKLIRQAENRGMSKNKADAIAFCKYKWVCILDSDNRIDENYLDALEKIDLANDTIYAPDFAKPNFNYTKFAGTLWTKETAKHYIKQPLGGALCNTCNYIVNSIAYGKVYKENKEIAETDTIYFLYLWLTAGNKLYVVPNMRYDHLVHSESGFAKNMTANMKSAIELENTIANL